MKFLVYYFLFKLGYNRLGFHVDLIVFFLTVIQNQERKKKTNNCLWINIGLRFVHAGIG
jgi:hypothetical protein